jgi:S-ribosylhomocysteine lyase LuxS involved in autoinducer biosynthesis
MVLEIVGTRELLLAIIMMAHMGLRTGVCMAMSGKMSRQLE